MMKQNKKVFSFLVLLSLVLILISTSFGAEVYNKFGDFSVEVSNLKTQVYNDDIKASLKFIIVNNLDELQRINLIIPENKGWDVVVDEDSFNLAPGNSKEVEVDFLPNSDFTYDTEIVSPDTIKISQKDNYKGYFKFPILIVGEEQNVSLNYEVEIDQREKEPVSYEIGVSTEDISPISPLKFTIKAENLEAEENVLVSVFFNDSKVFKEERKFTPENFFQFFSVPISNTFSPGKYNLKIVVRILDEASNSAKEWFATQNVNLLDFENIIVSEKDLISYISVVKKISIYNGGNKKSIFTKKVHHNFFKQLFFSANQPYTKIDGGVLFEIPLESGDSVELEYSYNYLVLYLVIFIVLLFGIFYVVRKNSNPILIETKFYDIKKVHHEGVKSFKVRIGFENVKEAEIDDLRIIFRMPAYINIKENSFLLSEPNQVLKSKNQYKLIWNFKRFEKSDSRILGFTLENKRGVLGDIKFDDIEIEVRIKGKTRKYYKSLPVIKG